MEAQVIKRPTDKEIVSAIRQGYNTSNKLVKYFFNKESIKMRDTDYKSLNKKIVSLRKYNIIVVKDIVGCKHVYEVCE